MDYTVVVAGAGPAGALAALSLARAGVRVLVLDRERPTRVEAAEIVAPAARAILQDEQVWPAIPGEFVRPCTAMAAAWETPEPAWTSFAGNPDGPAWHLDRIRFDAWMLAHIETAGAHVVRGHVDAVRREGEGWRIDFSAGGDSRTARARYLILATGRTSATVRLAPRRRIDTLCLVAGTTEPDPVNPNALVVEATADGWWYSAPLVDGRLFTGWMTDFSLVPDGRYEAAARASLATAPLHAERVGTPRLTTVIGAATWALSAAAGPGWIAIGDAALARDPIGGDGLTSAFRSACHASATVLRALNGDESAWTSAVAHTHDVAERHRRQRLDLYRVAQRRWPSAPFWQRFPA